MRTQEDLNSRAAGALALLAGGGLVVWSWRSALGDGQYGFKTALLGPTLLVLGIGLLIHGDGIPTSGATRLTRLYGVTGGLAAILNLYLLGFFSRPLKHRSVWVVETALPFLLLGVWALPSRFFGGETPPAATERAPSRPPPIEPE